jgi:predicted ATPase
MITAIEIENFKGIGNRVRVELKPLTLLFGPNSAGKSTILHAIHYAREIFDRRNLDADRTLAGGDCVDLGGFRSFVHGHDLSREVLLRFVFDVDIADLLADSEHDYDQFLKQTEGPISAWVEVVVGYHHTSQMVHVSRYAVGLADESFATVQHDADRRSVIITKLNCAHRLIARMHPQSVGDSMGPTILDELLPCALPEGLQIEGVSGRKEIPLHILSDALPLWDHALRIHPDWATTPASDSDGDDATEFRDRLEDLLTRLIVWPGRALQFELSRFRYVGPLRQAPPRHYILPRFDEPARWANGLAAWDVLSRAAPYGNHEFFNEVNRWLQANGAGYPGYELKVKASKELDTGTALYRSLVSGKAFDDIDDLRAELEQVPTQIRLMLVDQESFTPVMLHDVGVGISQLLPVIVAVVDGGFGILAIEQPELHIHPAMQVTLGDLFISRLSGDGSHQMIIETHSEHLLLRLLRRVRETTAGELSEGCTGLKADQLAVVYVEPGPAGTAVKLLPVTDDGDFDAIWPHGFFEEREAELF